MSTHEEVLALWQGHHNVINAARTGQIGRLIRWNKKVRVSLKSKHVNGRQGQYNVMLDDLQKHVAHLRERVEEEDGPEW